tara:strand:- start:8625 stop:8948 length:324 start_codon:yes stop_codon:yes gene_type:complete
MGKKRRLKSAKTKFKAKHSHHPRTRLLAQRAQEPSEPEVVEEIKVAAPPPEVEKLTPEIALKQEKPKPPVKASHSPSKVKKTTIPAKRKAAAPRKRTTKKKTTSVVA